MTFASRTPVTQRVLRGPRHRAAALHLLPALVALALILLLFPVSGQDDFFITLWPATTLAEQGEILNYNGARVEQSSTLLLTLVLAAGTKITGQDPASFARGLSLLAALSCFWGLARYFEPLASRLDANRSTLRAAWLLASAAPFLYWAASGTEMPIMAWLCLAWIACLHACLRETPRRTHFFALALVTAAAVLTRPEAAMVLLAALLGLALVCPRARPRVVLPLAMTTALGGALMLLRSLYFGLAWPLPVHAKIDVHGSRSARVFDGLAYLVADNGLSWLGVPLLVVVLVLVLPLIFTREDPRDATHAEARELALLAALVAGAYLGFAVTSGGDWMEGGRFVVPALPCLALALALGSSLRMKANTATRITWALVLLGALAIVRLALHPKTRALPSWRGGQLAGVSLKPAPPGAAPYELGARPWSERSNTTQLRDLVVLAFLDALVRRAEDAELGTLRFSSHQMGFVAYRLSRAHTGALHFIDAAGLVEPTLIECEAIADRVTRNAGGLWRVGYAYDPHLKVAFLLEDVRDCAPGPIDVLYELGIPDEALLRTHGLSLVYVQDGRFLGRPAYTFVAVRDDLLAPLGLTRVEVVEYSSAHGQVQISIGARP